MSQSNVGKLSAQCQQSDSGQTQVRLLNSQIQIGIALIEQAQSVADVFNSCSQPLKVGETRAVFSLEWMNYLKSTKTRFDFDDADDKSGTIINLYNLIDLQSMTSGCPKFKDDLVIGKDVLLMPTAYSDLLFAMYSSDPPLTAWPEWSTSSVYPNTGLVYKVPDRISEGNVLLKDVLTFDMYEVPLWVEGLTHWQVLQIADMLNLNDILHLALHGIRARPRLSQYRVHAVLQLLDESTLEIQLLPDQQESVSQLQGRITELHVSTTEENRSKRPPIPKISQSFTSSMNFRSVLDSLSDRKPVPTSAAHEPHCVPTSNNPRAITSPQDTSQIPGSSRVEPDPQHLPILDWDEVTVMRWGKFLAIMTDILGKTNMNRRAVWPVPVLNVGASCYLSVTLQCLARLYPLRDYFLHADGFIKDISSGRRANEACKGTSMQNIMLHFYHFMCYPWLRESGPFDPYHLLHNFQSIYRDFEPDYSHDALVCLCHLLEVMHNFLGVPRVVGPEGPIQGIENEQSVISDNFSGRQLNLMQCQLCNSEVRSVQPTRFLSLSPSEIVTGLEVYFMPLLETPMRLTLGGISQCLTVDQVLDIAREQLRPPLCDSQWVPYLFGANYTTFSQMEQGENIRVLREGKLLHFYETDRHQHNLASRDVVFLDFRRTRTLPGRSPAPIPLPPIRLVLTALDRNNNEAIYGVPAVCHYLRLFGKSIETTRVDWSDFRARQVHIIMSVDKMQLKEVMMKFWTRISTLQTVPPTEKRSEFSFWRLLSQPMRLIGLGTAESSRPDVRLEMLLDHYIRRSPLVPGSEFECRNCGASAVESPEHILTQTLVQSAPPVLVIHLRRFLQDDFPTQNTYFAKDDTAVMCPVVLNLTPFTVDKVSGQADSEDGVYSLIAVVNHHGDTLEDGHYSAIVRGFSEGEWYRMDDGSVSHVYSSQLLNPEGLLKSRDIVLLFYQSVKFPLYAPL